MNRVERWVHGWVEDRPALRSAIVRAYQALLSPVPAADSLPDGIVVHPGVFFGFHDKTPWSPDGTRVLAHAVPDRDTGPCEGPLEVGILDPWRPGTFRTVASTHAWNWQQGAELQWRGSTGEILFNEAGGPSGARAAIVDAEGTVLATLPHAASAVSRDGRLAASIDFGRLSVGMPGYGYASARDAAASLCELRVMDLVREETRVVFSDSANAGGGYRFTSHTAFSPDDRWIAFYVRTRMPRGRLKTELWLADPDGAERRRIEVADCSHYAWCDGERLLAYCRPEPGSRWGYCLVDVESGSVTRLSWLKDLPDGHPGSCAVHGLVVSDTYPDRRRLQRLLLLDLTRRTTAELARVRIPMRFRGEDRCDFHPRWSRDGGAICFDSAHTGRRSLCVLAVPGAQPTPASSPHARAEPGADPVAR